MDRGIVMIPCLAKHYEELEQHKVIIIASTSTFSSYVPRVGINTGMLWALSFKCSMFLDRELNMSEGVANA